ncbi:hypothetical protein [Streptomyces sp. GMY02]|nr:hypothetical protein [Streptomyces sp. GMY02]
MDDMEGARRKAHWDADRTSEVERQADEITQHVDDLVLPKASDHP